MSRLRTYGAVVIAMMLWSFSFVWFKIANKSYLPITIVLSRLLISSVILSLFLIFTGKFTRIRKKDRKLFLALALFEPFLYFLGESHGLTLVSATVGSVLISTIPVVAAIGARVILKERLKTVNYAGIIISFAGILVFLLDSTGSLDCNYKGLAMLSLAVLSAVGYNFMLGRLIGSYNPVYIINIQNIIGTILFLPVFLVTDLDHLIHTPFNLKHFVPILELAIFASCTAFILFAYSIRGLGVTRATAFTNCIPVFTAFFSFILLGDNFTASNISGLIIVITGLFLSQLNRRGADTGDALTLTGKTA
jgi:drug/metabolite transporter (DMT)-like permease